MMQSKKDLLLFLTIINNQSITNQQTPHTKITQTAHHIHPSNPIQSNPIQSHQYPTITNNINNNINKTMSTVTKTALPKINNIISGKQIPPLLQSYLPVLSPCTSQPIASVALSSAADVSAAIESSHAAFASWSSLTIKSRAAILLKFHSLVQAHRAELAALIVAENGKNLTEALADVAKGNETVEYACSLPQLAQGKTLKVSSAVSCTDQRTALGVVASIVPFNFPFMVPMWTLPIALVMGNTVVLKPSEKVPMTMYRTMELLKEAGLPDGVVNVVQGGREAVEAIIDHDLVRAVTFVGSSPIAKLISERCSKLHKRCTALGGAKNHLIALPDCHLEETARDIVVSSMGCAGQRCMAASVLLLVAAPGDHDHDHEKQRKLLEMVVEKARALEKGTGPGQLGPVIDEASYDKIHSYIQQAEASGAKILLDGRTWANPSSDSDNGGSAGGKWVGPTIIHHSSKDDAAMKEEIFGPVLSIYNTSSWIEAIEIENSNPFGNAACVYTSNGGYADWFTSRFQAGMLGVNVGIPVPREPFSFGGLYGTRSKYGDMDITGDGGMEFFSHRIKVTKKWIVPDEDVLGFATAPGSGGGGVNGANGDMNGNGRSGAGGTAPVDQANFAGTM